MAKTKKSPGVKKVEPVTKKVEETAVPTSESMPKESRSYVIPVLVLIALVIFGAIIYRWMVVARVNSIIINRVAFYRELQRQAGKQVLEDMITRSLMKQALEDKRIVVTDAEVDKEIANLEKQLKERNQKLEDILKQQSVTKEELRENIRLNKGFEKLFADKIKISDDEVKKYIEENESLFAEGTSDEKKIEQARQLLRTRKLSQEYQNWLSSARAKATIVTSQ